MKEVILCKYGEVVLKGANRSDFEAKMLKDLRNRARRVGNFNIFYSQSTVFIEPLDEESIDKIDEMTEQAKHVFGFVGITRAAACAKDMDEIIRVVKEYIPTRLNGCKTFKADAKRSDKRFPLSSPQIAGEVGAAVLEATGGRVKVDLYNPDIVVRVEVREKEAYIHAGQEKGAGGIPYGSSGRGLLLLSGGIDSPVAGFMMAKRGLRIEAVHFESFPYTSEMARDKVIRLARTVAAYTGDIYVHVVSLTKIQEEIAKHCEEDYFTLLLRRYMMTIACRIAAKHDSKCLITGESLGQVASQTMEAIAVTDNASSLPVFRPCIGMDKEEIVDIARKIGTFDISIEPYEDCCTVFTPRHPRTKPVLEKVLREEQKLDFEALVAEAIESAYTIRAQAY